MVDGVKDGWRLIKGSKAGGAETRRRSFSIKRNSSPRSSPSGCVRLIGGFKKNSVMKEAVVVGRRSGRKRGKGGKSITFSAIVEIDYRSIARTFMYVLVVLVC